MKFIASRALLFFGFLAILTVLVAYARGYRINFDQQKVVPTGILVASSSPNGAKIYINGELHGATNSNITLPPGGYDVEIKKDGFSSWKKNIIIKGELVVKADALLFPQNPSLSPITSLGVVSVSFFPNSEKTIILAENPNNLVSPTLPDEMQRDGIYLLESSKRPLNIFNPLKLLVQTDSFVSKPNFEDSQVVISPDGEQILFSTSRGEGADSTYLFSTVEITENPFNVTQSKQTIETAWKEEEAAAILKILETFKDPLPKVASDSFHIVHFSPDQRKILYVAKEDKILPAIIKPPLIGSNQTEEEREIKKGSLYVYDKTEDKNFKIFDASEMQEMKQAVESVVLWYPDSTHLVLKELPPKAIQDVGQISIVDYDGTNKRIVYSGPFERDFLGITADGKLLILANLNPQTNKLPDIYAVGIR